MTDRLDSIGIYIHVPYCMQKCHYCAFHSNVGLTVDEERKYILEIRNEIKRASYTYGYRNVDTIFFGGGTPSILSKTAINLILEQIFSSFRVKYDAEITIEANPKTLNYTKLTSYRQNSINRLSMGVQSFDDDILKKIGRIHSATDVLRDFDIARSVGFDNINLDLMLALPSQSIKTLKDTLKTAIALSPEHISFYSLQLEEGTLFYQLYKDDRLQLVSDEEERKMYWLTREFLENNGYNCYEISNASRPNYECKHNLKYWDMREFLGFGNSASSYINQKRIRNKPDEEVVSLSTREEMGVYMFTSLRLTKGMDFDRFYELFGMDFWDAFKKEKREIQEAISEGFLSYTNNGLTLTNNGVDNSNSIMAIFVDGS